MRRNEVSKEKVQEITLKLLDYCKKNDWAGYDPYDALNSEIFKALPFLDFKLFRLGLTQVMKRSPFNLRPLLLVPKTQNPKAIALFLMAFLKLEKLGLLADKNLIPLMVDRLIALRSPEELVSQPPSLQVSQLISFPAFEPAGAPAPRSSASQPWSPSAPPEAGKPASCVASQLPSIPASKLSYCCWGYSFPWQTRSVLVTRETPNLVCTSFVANALLDAYERSGETKCLDMAVSAAEYILRELYWTDGHGTACFAYPLPSSRARVHNANFLGAAVLCRVYKQTGDKKYLEPALKVARYSAAKQHDDGSWDYGEGPTQRWIDNFHTGYNLCALRDIGIYARTQEFESLIQRGFKFYRDNLFRDDGAPKYFHNRTYPIDVHSVAQSIITLLAFKGMDENSVMLANAVFRWAMANIWDEQGFFYYRVLSLLKTRISYMRWSQAWMLLALSTLLEE